MGARCLNWARRVLCGGRVATRVPTATSWHAVGRPRVACRCGLQYGRECLFLPEPLRALGPAFRLGAADVIQGTRVEMLQRTTRRAPPAPQAGRCERVPKDLRAALGEGRGNGVMLDVLH